VVKLADFGFSKQMKFSED